MARKLKFRKHPVCRISNKSVMDRCCDCKECKQYRADEQKERRKNRPDLVKRNNLRQYGLTLKEWESMVEFQNNVCAVCFQPELGHNQHGPMALAVDHDHGTGKVRALLCHKCNRALGLLGDDYNRVQALADYRRKYD